MDKRHYIELNYTASIHLVFVACMLEVKIKFYSWDSKLQKCLDLLGVGLMSGAFFLALFYRVLEIEAET